MSAQTTQELRDATARAVRHAGARFAAEMARNGWEHYCRRFRRDHCSICGAWGLRVWTWRRRGLLGRTLVQTVECPACGHHARDVDVEPWDDTETTSGVAS